MNPVKTGALIREQRIENHLTEQELAEKAGISVELLESYEHGTALFTCLRLKEADRAGELIWTAENRFIWEMTDSPEKRSGILCLDAYTDEDWEKYGDHIACEKYNRAEYRQWIS